MRCAAVNVPLTQWFSGTLFKALAQSWLCSRLVIKDFFSPRIRPLVMIIEGFRAAEMPPLVQGRRKEVASVAALGGESHYLSVAHGSSSRRRRGAADHMIPGLSVRSRLPLCIAAQISGPYGPRMKPGVLRAACRGRAAECEAHQSDAGSDDETWFPSLHQCNRPLPPRLPIWGVLCR